MKKDHFLPIDKRATGLMICLSVISVLTLAYRYKTRTVCETYPVKINSFDFHAGSAVFFSAPSGGELHYSWDFDDGTPDRIAGNTVSHIYKEPGLYRVSLHANGTCEELITVNITDKPPVLKTRLPISFVCPDTAYVNRKIFFTDTLKGNTGRQWFFDETGAVNSTERTASWMYSSPGLKTVYCKLLGADDLQTMKIIRVIEKESPVNNIALNNKANKTRERIIYIKDKPDESSVPLLPPVLPQPEKAKPVPEIQPEEMSSLLELVVTGSKTASDFSDILNGNINCSVVYNDDIISFKEMCNQLSSIKKISKIKKPVVIIRRDKTTGNINYLNVTVERIGIIGRLLKRKR